MRVLIIGGDGMLGHQLLQLLQYQHEVKVTLRQPASVYQAIGYFNEKNAYFNIDIAYPDRLLSVFSDFSPEIVINAVGMVKQRSEAKEVTPSLEINALFPQHLALLCKVAKARLILMSTDCVFSGEKGSYKESDTPDPKDVYGMSKFLGEVSEEGCITLRTSIIGLELFRKQGLIEWFLAQRGSIKGYRRAIYSGFTTLEMARIIHFIITKQPQLHGLWHVASTPINKFELLQLLAKYLERKDISIEPYDDFYCDRSLDGSRFIQASGYAPPSWETMLSELAQHVK
jgi:dTDP-4-dehydrorhamnose reductase